MQRARRGFVTRWTVAGDATARTITLPLNNGNGASFNCTVNWGDGTTSTITAVDDADRIHTYAADGTYIVEIRGTCEGWSFNNGGDKLKLSGVLHWGSHGVAFSGFKYLVGALYGCANCTSIGVGPIPASGAGPTSLSNAFRAMGGGFALPPHLLDELVNVTDMHAAFYASHLTDSLPTDFLRKLTLVTIADSCFANNSFTGEIPAGFLRYNTALVTIGPMFANNTALVVTPWIFYADGEQATRFLNKSVGFDNCFLRTSYTGAQGTAPDLWSCSFGTGTITKAGCFANASLAMYSNVADIPAAWK